MKKILVTGAHFTTALAVIEQLRNYPKVEIVYVGRKTTREGDSALSPESQILPERGIKFIPIIAGRLQKSFTIYTIPSLLKIPIGLVQSIIILFKEKPDLILSFGGYVSLPLVIVGWFLSIPIIIHEQTLVSGLANRISAIFADKIALSFPNSNYPKQKTILTGNPIRGEILNEVSSLRDHEVTKQSYNDMFLNLFRKAKKEKLPVILITGGNQGSHVINKAVETSLDQLQKIACVIHQTGDSKYKDFENLESKQSEKYLVAKFINQEMPYILRNCDLVISRAGINTLTEMSYLSKPGLVIPIPYIYNDEQNQNAKYFEKLGLVKILPQTKLPSDFLTTIKQMLKNLDDLKKQALNVKSTLIPDAANRLALEVILMLDLDE